MNSKELISWLNNIYSFARNSLIITVPGGGEFAENIRKMQSNFNFNDKVAHRMALYAMCQYGQLLASINSDIKIITNTEKFNTVKNISGSYLWLPIELIDDNTEILESWNFTSDSIALWLATKINADKLVIVKSKKIIFNQSYIKQHIINGDIDKGFKDLVDKYNGELIFLEKSEYNRLVKIV